MVAKVLDIALEERLIAERQAQGIDRFDEVWDGVYVMSPLADDEHQEIAAFLTRVLFELIQDTKRGFVRPGINLSDRPQDWTKSYRVPDVAVFLHGGNGVCHGKFWTCGPDLAVEIVSEGEDPAEKFEFYGGLATRELLVIDRDPWRLELYGSSLGSMQLLQSCNLNEAAIYSTATDLAFSLRADESEVLLVVEQQGGRRWVL